MEIFIGHPPRGVVNRKIIMAPRAATIPRRCGFADMRPHLLFEAHRFVYRIASWRFPAAIYDDIFFSIHRLYTSASMVRTQIYLTKHEHDRLRRLATRTGRSQSELIRAAVDLWLEQQSLEGRHQILKDVAGIWRE